MWQPDGWGVRARIGVLVPDVDVGPEAELAAMAPEGVSVHAARVPLTVAGTAFDPCAFVAAANLDGPAASLAAAPLHAIGLAFASSSYACGADADDQVRRRLERHAHGIPVALAAPAAVEALRALGAGRLALIDAPWFPAALTAKGADYFRRHGLEVVHAAAMELPGGAAGASAVELQRAVHPGQLYEWARAKVPATADAVFIGGNGFRAVGAIQALEEDLAIPVLTANQALLWRLLGLAGTRSSVVGYGRLFALAPPA